MTRHLRIRIALSIALTLACVAPARAQTNEALLDTLQHAGVMYFWNEANPANGLIKDRTSNPNFCSIAANGFGFSAIAIGAERGWIDKDQARARTLLTLQTFWNGPQGTGATGTIGYKGFFYHFLNMNTATRFATDVELSTIDTALLFAGILDAKHYWTSFHPDDVQIRALADSITYRADWNFMRNFNPGVFMGWKPGTGFGGFGQWVGYNEAMILYLLALGSPTHQVPTTAWSKWTSNYNLGTHYGYTFLTCPPLFTHQYSHCWVDFRGIQDAYMQAHDSLNYFENSRRATLAQREYCIDNPGNWVGYSDSLWGLTAGDDQDFGYIARGAPPAQNDNGTISPTAGISSLPFTPTESLQLIRNLWNNWRATVWGPYGYKDAFRPTTGWVATDVLGIDQGPIVLMIENYRTGKVWSRMMAEPQIQTGLERAGFVVQPSTGVEPVAPTGVRLRAVVPNPARATTTVRFTLPRAGFARLEVFDSRGRRVAQPLARFEEEGEHAATVTTDGLAPGLYWIRLSTPAGVATTRFARVR